MIVVDLGNPDVAKVAGDVGQQVGARIANFVQHLLRDTGASHEAARPLGLRDDERSVAAALHDRIADVGPVRHGFPICVQSSSRLAAAFDDVTRQAAAGQSVVIIRRPTEFVDQRTERHGAVDPAPGDDDVSASRKGARDRQRPEIRVGAQNICRRRGAREHVGDAPLSQARHHVPDVVAIHNCDRR